MIKGGMGMWVDGLVGGLERSAQEFGLFSRWQGFL